MKRASRNVQKDTLVQHASQLLRAHDLRVTDGRVRVLTKLMEAHEPLAIDALASMVTDINTVTLYRMLDRFAAEGIVYRTDFRNGKAFFEYQPTHHHHVTCTRCGVQEAVDVCVRAVQERVKTQTHQFAAVESHMLEFFGTCKKCLQT